MPNSAAHIYYIYTSEKCPSLKASAVGRCRTKWKINLCTVCRARVLKLRCLIQEKKKKKKSKRMLTKKRKKRSRFFYVIFFPLFFALAFCIIFIQLRDITCTHCANTKCCLTDKHGRAHGIDSILLVAPHNFNEKYNNYTTIELLFHICFCI